MTLPAIAVTDEQLRDAHRRLGEPVSFEAMAAHPALLICLRNMAEIHARPKQPRPACVDLKRRAANDID